MACSWVIVSPSGAAIKLGFTEFGLEQNFDFVKVYDGPSASSPILGSLTGFARPAPLTATSGAMFVLFTTDFLGSEVGFTGEFETGGSGSAGGFVPALPSPMISPAPVIGFVNAPSSSSDAKVTKSPTSTGAGAVCFGGIAWTTTLTWPQAVAVSDGPGRYAPNSDCQWTLKVPAGGRIRLVFSMLNLEVGYDTLVVYDGPSTSSPKLAALSGSTIPGALTSTGDTILVGFKSDNDLEQDGFDATFGRVNPVTGGMYLDSSGESTSAGNAGDSESHSAMGKTVLFAGLGTLGVLAMIVGLLAYRRLRRTSTRVSRVTSSSSPSRADPIQYGTSAHAHNTDDVGVGDVEMHSPSGRTAVGAPWDLPLIDLEEMDFPVPPQKPRVVWQEDC